MTKAELVRIVQNQLGHEISKAQAERVLNAVLKAIERGLKAGRTVQLSGFGTFRISRRAARVSRNPATGEMIRIKSSKTVRFSAGKGLKSAIATGTESTGPKGAEDAV